MIGAGGAVLMHYRVWYWPGETDFVQLLVIDACLIQLQGVTRQKEIHREAWSLVSGIAENVVLSGMCFCVVECVGIDISKKLLFLYLTRKASRSFETSWAARPSHSFTTHKNRISEWLIFLFALLQTDSEESLVPVIQLEADAITTHSHRFSALRSYKFPSFIECDDSGVTSCCDVSSDHTASIKQSVTACTSTRRHLSEQLNPPPGFLAPQLVPCLARCSRSPGSNHKLLESPKAPMTVCFRIPFFRDMTPHRWRFEIALCLRVRARGPTFGPNDAVMSTCFLNVAT
jgi:hypothetical protein